MRTKIMIAALVLLCQNVFASAQWPNEPAGSQLALDCPFTGQLCAGMFNVYKNLPFVNITLPGQQPASPTGVLDYNLPVGATEGGGQFGYDFPSNLGHTVREVYLATWWATNPGSDWNYNNGNKMIFISADGDNNFLGWQGFNDVPGNATLPKTLVWANQSIWNNCHVSGWSNGGCGDGVHQASGYFAPNGSHNGVVAVGSGWHLIEIYQRASTTASSRDGIVRIWVDGQLSTNYTNVNIAPNGFHSVQYNSTWGGFICGSTGQVGRDCTKERHHYYDHLRVSIPNGAPIPVLPLAITSPLQTSAQVGTAYSATLGAENGKAPYAWTISAGSIPPGLTLNKTTGVLSGTPTTIGRSDFTVKVMDSSVPAAEATKAFTIIVSRSTGTGIGKTELTVNGSWLTAESRMGSVRFHLPQAGAYTLSVYDLSGKKVFEGKASAGGQNEIRIETALKNGIYLATFKQGREVSTVRFNVMN